mmetsp:Transcript_23439/g.51457  ORF Transcript_23439/g.51457 Transcript_23439/m.51457 type:complete len:136 (-) Transcript_23439:46-453(-)
MHRKQISSSITAAPQQHRRSTATYTTCAAGHSLHAGQAGPQFLHQAASHATLGQHPVMMPGTTAFSLNCHHRLPATHNANVCSGAALCKCSALPHISAQRTPSRYSSSTAAIQQLCKAVYAELPMHRPTLSLVST